MNKLLVILFSLLAGSLEAATITNWGAQLPTAAPAGGDVILMQKGGVTYYFTPNQLAANIATNSNSAMIANLNGRATNTVFYGTLTGATVRATNIWDRNNVKYWGAVGDGVTDDTMAIALAITNSQGEVRFPPGVYITAGICIRTNNLALVGSGSALTTIKLKAGGDTTNVVELGDTASGNSAAPYTNLTISGLTIDGNKLNCPSNTTDITGWGLIMTKISYSRLSDLRVVNCGYAGIGMVILSSYNFVDAYVGLCGGNAFQSNSGFDVNSSSYNHITVTVDRCASGVRLLDNCYGNVVNASIYWATNFGFIYNNQAVNKSQGNIITATIQSGCASGGFLVGANCRSSQISMTGVELSGIGLYEVGIAEGAASTNLPSGNSYSVNTREGQRQSVSCGGIGSVWDIVSTQDGKQGAAGTHYAVDVYGTNHTFNAVIYDASPFQVRGLNFRASSQNNTITSLKTANVTPVFTDAGTNNLATYHAATNMNQYGGFGVDQLFFAGASERMRIAAASGNVGIGLTVPTSALHVKGVDTATVLRVMADTGGLRVRPYVSAANGAYFESLNLAENTYLPLTINASTTIMGFGGNVGIYTTTPTNQLDVNGHVTIVSNVFLPGLRTNGSPVAFLATDAAGAVYETAAPTGGGGSLMTNDNQFGASTTLTIRSGALVTNLSISTSTNTGPALFLPDNSHDIGASGAARPRNVFAANHFETAAYGFLSDDVLRVGPSGYFTFFSRFKLQSPSDGVVTFLDSTDASVNRVQLGGTTAAFPAIGRTNGILAVIGANGLFAGGNTNHLWMMGGGIIQDFSLVAPAAPDRQGAVYWNDGTNVCVVLRNSAGGLATNKLSMTAWP